MVLSFYDRYFGDRFRPKKTVGPEQDPNWRKSFQKQRVYTVKPLLSGHLRDLPKCPLNRGCLLNRGCKNCAMFVNDQQSTVTLYMYCDKVACC